MFAAARGGYGFFVVVEHVGPRELVFDSRVTGQLRVAHAVPLSDLPADLVPDPLRRLFGLVFDFDFDKQVGALHSSDPHLLY